MDPLGGSFGVSRVPQGFLGVLGFHNFRQGASFSNKGLRGLGVLYGSIGASCQGAMTLLGFGSLGFRV